MADHSDAGEHKRPFSGHGDPRFHAPFTPPFSAPFTPPFSAPFIPPFAVPFSAPFQPPGPSPFTAEWYRPFLEAQRAYFTWYRAQLQQWSGDNAFDDRMREALNALMVSWLESVRSLREQREQAVRAQTELVTRYLEVLDQLLDGPGDGAP